MYISAIHGRRRLFLPLWRRWSAELAARNRRNGGVRHRFGAPRSFAQAAAAAPCLTKERRALRRRAARIVKLRARPLANAIANPAPLFGYRAAR